MTQATPAPDKMGIDDHEMSGQVAQRFAKFLAIGASRLLATDPALLGVAEQEQFRLTIGQWAVYPSDYTGMCGGCCRCAG